jgi:class 3 adenylate cyclase
MSFGKKLKDLRNKFSLKQLDLANSLRVTVQAVSKWERDENYPDILTLKKMSRFFDVSIDELLGMYDETRDVFDATIFCSGIRRFAERSAKLSPKDLAGSMNAILTQMTETVLKHGGVPVKYTGDGFLCFFSGMDQADRALEAAARIVRIHQDKDILILLNAGQIYLGKVGHPDYAVKDIYGDTVNRSFLMMQAFSSVAGKGIGCSSAVKDILKEEHVFKTWRGLRVKELKEEFDLYELKKMKNAG